MAGQTNIFLPTFALDLTRDNSVPAGGATLPTTPLFIGQKLTTGAGANGSIHEIATLSDVEALAGKGSTLYAMAKTFFSKRGTNNLAIGILDDAASSTAATRSMTVTTGTVGNGVLSFRVNGEKMLVSVVSTDTATTIGDKIVSEINKDDSRRVTAANAGGVVTLTARNKGIAAGGITLGVNTDPSDRLVAGVTVTIGAETAGTLDPDVQDVFDNIGDHHNFLIASPYSDAVSLATAATITDELGDKFNARDSIYVTMVDGDKATIKALAAGVGSKYVAILDREGWQSDIYTMLGSLGREVATSVKSDTNGNLQNLTLPGTVPPIGGTERVWEDRNDLAANGVGGFDPNKGTLESPVTTSLENSEDRRWENVFNLAELRISFKELITRKYGRAKLKTGAERVSPSQVVINTDIAKSEAVAWYEAKIFSGQVEDLASFSTSVDAQITDVDTITWTLPVKLVGQLVVNIGNVNYLLGGN